MELVPDEPLLSIRERLLGIRLVVRVHPRRRVRRRPRCEPSRAVDARAARQPCQRCPTARCRHSPARSGRTSGPARGSRARSLRCRAGRARRASASRRTDELRRHVDARPGHEDVAVDALVGRDRDDVDARSRRPHARRHGALVLEHADVGDLHGGDEIRCARRLLSARRRCPTGARASAEAGARARGS